MEDFTYQLLKPNEKINKLSAILSKIMFDHQVPNNQYIITGSYGFGPYYPTNNLDVIVDDNVLNKLQIKLIKITPKKYKYDMTSIYNNLVDENTNDFAIYFHTEPISQKYSIENLLKNPVDLKMDNNKNIFISGKTLLDFRNDINRPVILVGGPFDTQLEHYYNKYKKYKEKYMSLRK